MSFVCLFVCCLWFLLFFDGLSVCLASCLICLSMLVCCLFMALAFVCLFVCLCLGVASSLCSRWSVFVGGSVSPGNQYHSSRLCCGGKNPVYPQVSPPSHPHTPPFTPHTLTVWATVYWWPMECTLYREFSNWIDRFLAPRFCSIPLSSWWLCMESGRWHGIRSGEHENPYSSTVQVHSSMIH